MPGTNLPIDLDPEPWDWKRLRDRSSALFGSQHRLGVAALALTAEEKGLYAAHIAARGGISRAEAIRQLARLERAELLTEAGLGNLNEKGRPAELYSRVDDDVWKLIDVLTASYRS
jgi:predicted ArsR family transcriptional regulator